MTDEKTKTPPRIVPSWDDYFLHVARGLAIRSKDPNTQIGCCIACLDKRIVATGYNGPPPGIDDQAIDWSRPQKYTTTIHAEANALLHSTHHNMKDCVLYVTGTPCSHCMLMIAAKQIKRVVYSTRTKVHMVDEDDWAKTLYIARLCGISLEGKG